MDELLRQDSSFLIGSRALGVDTEASDYDIAITLEDFKKSNILAAKVNKSYNYTTSPLLMYSKLYTLKNIDIFVFTDKTKLLKLKETYNFMARLPKFLVSNKISRIIVFRLSLYYKGFYDG